MFSPDDAGAVQCVIGNVTSLYLAIVTYPYLGPVQTHFGANDTPIFNFI